MRLSGNVFSRWRLRMPWNPTLILTLGASLVLACGAADPVVPTEAGQALHFAGVVRLEGDLPDPTVLAWADAYSTALPRGVVSHTLPLDSTGAYVGAFAPFPRNRIDSLVVSAAQLTCDGSPTASLRYPGLHVSAEMLRLPLLDLRYPQPTPTLQAGIEICGAFRQPFSGSILRLSLIMDSLADSAFGRYAIGHDDTVTFDQGGVAGQVSDSLLVLRFVSEHYPPCTGMNLGIPLIHRDSLGLATLTGAAEDFCNIPSGRLRLFPHHHGFPPLPP